MISAKRVSTPSRLRRAVIALALLALPAAALPAAASAATPGPAFSITATASPTNFVAGEHDGRNFYLIDVRNIGSKDTTTDPITITDVLPPGFSVNPKPGAYGFVSFKGESRDKPAIGPCEAGPPVTCTFTKALHPGEELFMYLPTNTEAGVSGVVTNRFSVSGGGTPGASGSLQTPVSSEPAPFEVQNLEMLLSGVDGNTETRAGSHPYEMHVGALFSSDFLEEGPGSTTPPAENPRTIFATLPKGLAINPHATTTLCTEAQLESGACPRGSVVGLAHVGITKLGPMLDVNATGLYNLVPPPGSAAAFGFNAAGFGIFVHLLARVRSDGDYELGADARNIPQYGQLGGATLEFWGNPSSPSHDYLRGQGCSTYLNGGKPACPTEPGSIPLITMPSACSGPLSLSLSADSWQNPGKLVSGSVQSTDYAGNPVGVTGCDKLPYNPSTETVASTDQAETGSGFDFSIDFPNDGLLDESALAESTTDKAVVTLPEGLTINPSVGEGLGFCTPAQYARETVDSIDGEGCPADSKIGTLSGETPLVDGRVGGYAYLAQQDDPGTSEHGAENPFDSLIAAYLVIRNPILGVMVKKPLLIEPDPKSGQLVATLDDIPQIPFSHATFHFREGARAALITPPRCGRYTTVAKLYPSADPSHAKTVSSDFEITKGVNGGSCPAGGIPPFNPRFEAGSENNSAGAFSPFDMSLTRADGEQDMTKFSAILPPGELGSLAGVSKCPDSAIAIAKSKTGRQEQASPSCPANSLIGHTLAGAGVGDSLTYVPGQLYLGGPFHGDPLSVISITPGVAGPFDAGTVVVQLALTLNSKTAEVEVDGANSDPIPHILKGIVLKVRDLRVFVDRPDFTLNPTSCDPSKVNGTLFGAYLNVFDPGDDLPIALQTRYQAADCQSLPYKPALDLKLKGGTRRGGHPGLLATYKARKGDANTKGIVVRLPRSAFLDQAHIRTICTRVQFAAKACPPAAQYGFIRAWTPLLDEPLEGPVWLRSSNHKLPDLVFDLHGLVDVEVSTRIDSARGGIRASIENSPDAPLSKVLLRMQGGRKGLIVNSRNLCGSTNRAAVEFTGHNGKEAKLNPVMRPDCGGKRKHKRHRG